MTGKMPQGRFPQGGRRAPGIRRRGRRRDRRRGAATPDAPAGRAAATGRRSAGLGADDDGGLQPRRRTASRRFRSDSTRRACRSACRSPAGPDNDHVAVAVALELERAFGGWVPPTDPRSGGAVMSDPVRHHCLFYDYVEDAVEKRAPYRADHLAHAPHGRRKGRIVMAGALGKPPHGAMFVFLVDDPERIEEFRRRRPVRRGRHRDGAPRGALDRRERVRLDAFGRRCRSTGTGLGTCGRRAVSEHDLLM